MLSSPENTAMRILIAAVFTLTVVSIFQVLCLISQNVQFAELPRNLYQGPALDQLGPYSVLILTAVSDQVMLSGTFNPIRPGLEILGGCCFSPLPHNFGTVKASAYRVRQ